MVHVVVASDSPSPADSALLWPGPDAVSATFRPVDTPMLFQGEGGSVATVRGVDLWIVGRPSRVNRVLGILTIKVAGLQPGQPAQLNNRQFNVLIEDTVVKEASKAGAVAAILMEVSKEHDGTSTLYYRLITYLPEGAVADVPISRDPTIRDADGRVAPNGSEVPLKMLEPPIMLDGDRPLPDGHATVNICVGANGRLTGSSIVVSSGDNHTDGILYLQIKYGKYSAATVHGHPIDSCEDFPLSWKTH